MSSEKGLAAWRDKNRKTVLILIVFKGIIIRMTQKHITVLQSNGIIGHLTCVSESMILIATTQPPS